MITWERRAPHGRQNQEKPYPFFNRGGRGTQGTNFTGKMKQWENKEPLPAVLTTWAFIPELPQKQKNQTDTEAAEMKTYLDGFETSQGFFTVSTRSTTD